jgi:carboxyl-terminal processing protease
MRFRIRLGFWVLAALAVIGATGCVDVSPLLRGHDPASVAAPSTEVFQAGYTAIAERYIRPLGADTIALSGLRGLSSIDPSLSIESEGKVVVVRSNGREVALLAAPSAGDVHEWALTTTDALLMGRQVSPSLASAPAERVYKAVFGSAIAALDPYARYVSADEAQNVRERRDGYVGLGFSFRIDDSLVRVTSVTPKSPAARVGLHVGDVITGVDGMLVSKLRRSDLVEVLRGENAGKVIVTVQRPGLSPRRLILRRSLVVPETITDRLDDGIVYITISSFNNATADSISASLNRLKARQRTRLRGVVLDLRGNNGGLLLQAVRVADMFLADGPIVTTLGRHPDSVHTYSASGPDQVAGAPIVLLIDGATASAAELLAASLHDRGRAVIVGTTSYGKVAVQTVVPLPNQGELAFTWSHLLPPSGVDLQGIGVVPDLCTRGLQDEASGTVPLHTLIRETAAVGTEGGDGVNRSCSPERRNGEAEREVARRLIFDSRFYGRILRRQFGTSAAANGFGVLDTRNRIAMVPGSHRDR